MLAGRSARPRSSCCAACRASAPRSSCRRRCRSSPTSSPTTTSGPTGDRAVGRRVGSRGRHRPVGRRLPARALLVGLDLPRERADRASSRSSAVVAIVPESRDEHAPRLDLLGTVLVDRRSDRAAVRHHRGPVAGLDRSARDHRRVRRRRRAADELRASGSATPTIRSSTVASSPTHGSPPPRSRSRSCSSPCSARCSSSASTCSSCSATRALESGVRAAAGRGRR